MFTALDRNIIDVFIGVDSALFVMNDNRMYQKRRSGHLTGIPIGTVHRAQSVQVLADMRPSHGADFVYVDICSQKFKFSSEYTEIVFLRTCDTLH